MNVSNTPALNRDPYLVGLGLPNSTELANSISINSQVYECDLSKKLDWAMIRCLMLGSSGGLAI